MEKGYSARRRSQYRRGCMAEQLERRELLTTLPTGFTEVALNSRLDAAPVSLLQTPDGRLLVTTDDNDNIGAIRVIKNGVVLPTPALRLNVVSDGEFGIVGVLLDPDFSQNNFIYVYYTTNQGGLHNRLSRFKFSGDVVMAGSETILMDFDTLGSATVHNGGGMVFGRDGKLYLGVGENGDSANARTLTNRLGKIVRLNADGSIPTDNPFYNVASGANRAIYALGVRNPFTMDIDPQTGKIYVNDVGPASFEEINEIRAGADYGWPIQVGPGNNSLYTNPVYAYRHNDSRHSGCAISGGRFNRPSNTQIPAAFANQYYFVDFCGAWIDTYDLNTGQVRPFATGLHGDPVSLLVDPTGAIYYLSRTDRVVYKIDYPVNAPLTVTQPPQNATVAVGEGVSFSVSVSGSQPITYQWQKQTGSSAFVNVNGATSSSLSIPSAVSNDDGSRYRVVATNAFGSVTSSSATLTVLSANRPQPIITLPLTAATYAAGDVITFTGSATDPDEVGNLPPNRLTWEVRFQHDDHFHPFVDAFSGQTGGTFVVPTVGETSDNVWYRVYLTATDATGLTTTVTRDIFPKKSLISLRSNVPGITLTLDGSPVSSPFSVLGVVGITRAIGAADTQVINGQGYRFAGWSDGGTLVHSISTPAANTTYTAMFEPAEVSVSDDPVTVFTLDEGTGPSSADSASQGVGDTAVLTNGASWSPAGKINGAVRFDGVDDRLVIPDSVDFNNRTVAKTTIAFWFNADDVTRPATQLLYKQSGDKRGLNIYLDSGRLYVGAWSDEIQNWGGTFLSTAAIQSNRWHHVALVLDADGNLSPDRLRGYLDGTQFGSGPAAEIDKHLGDVSLGSLQQSTLFHSGASGGGTAVSPFAGFIDEIRVYHRPLSASEVQALVGTVQPSAAARLSINDVSQFETNSGATNFVFTVTTDKVLAKNISVRVDTANLLAQAGSDYTAIVNQTATIAAGTTSTTVTVSVSGDSLVEPDETFMVNLSVPRFDGIVDASQVVIADGVGLGTIRNDDATTPNPGNDDAVTRFTLDEGQGPFASDSASSGVEDRAILTNGAIWSSAGIISGAVQFDGVDDRLVIPDSADINGRTVSKTTIAFWFRADDITRSGKQILYKQSGDKRGLGIYLDGGRLYIGAWSDKIKNWVDTANQPGTFLSTAAIQSNRWHHVALVLDATGTLSPDRLRGYLDGVLFGSGQAAEIKKHSGNISLGSLDQSTLFHTGASDQTTRVSPFIGFIDDIRIYHRPLTASELVALANVTSPSPAVALASTIADGELIQNRVNTADVDNDGTVTPRDALLIMNEISRSKSRSGEAPASNSAVRRYPDVNGDGQVTARDALQVINSINRSLRFATSNFALSPGPDLDDDDDADEQDELFDLIADDIATVWQ